MNVTKVFQKIKKKGLLSIEKNIKREKMVYYNYEKVFYKEKYKGFDFSARKFSFPEI